MRVEEHDAIGRRQPFEGVGQGHDLLGPLATLRTVLGHGLIEEGKRATAL